MQARSVVLLFFALMFVSLAQANTCGSSASRFLVPDYVCFDAQGGRKPFANCAAGRTGGTLVRQSVDFTSACFAHDACYGTNGAQKADCDGRFFEDMKLICRERTGNIGSEKMFLACIDTALQFNDVVRGQATRRMGLWMVQQVPFTGQTGCAAYSNAQIRAGNQKPSCVGNSESRNLLGHWYDGGPGCVSLRQGTTARHLVLRAWYCESSESQANRLVLEHDATVDAYVHELTGLTLRVLAGGMQIEISAKGEVRNRLGTGTYLPEEVRTYHRN